MAGTPDNIQFHITILHRKEGKDRQYRIRIGETGHYWARMFDSDQRVIMLKKKFEASFCKGCPLGKDKTCSKIHVKTRKHFAHRFTLEADADEDIFNPLSMAWCMKTKRITRET